MPLTPEQRAELESLKSQGTPAPTKSRLTPEQQAELAALKAQGPAEPTPQPPDPEERSPFSISADGLGKTLKAPIMAASNLFGVGPKISAALRTGVGQITGDPRTAGDQYDQELALFRGAQAKAYEDAPGPYIAGEVALASALPVQGTAAMIGQGVLQAGLGSDKEGYDKVADMVKGAIPAAAFGLAGKTMGAIANSKYGKAFSGGSEVQKFASPNAQQDLANKVSEAITEKVAAARTGHAAARKAFLEQKGNVVVDASDVADKVVNSVQRFGMDAAGAEGKTFGSLAPKEAKDLGEYVDALSQPRTAQELYKIWDDIGTKAKYYENTLKTKASEINNQLQSLRAGIKEKLHGLGGGLAEADAAMENIIDQSKHVARGANETSNESFLSTLGNKNRGNRQDAVQELLKDSPEVLNQIDNFQTNQAFNGQGGTGSIHGIRNVGGASIGGAIGGAIAGPVGMGLGIAAGGLASHPPNQRAALAAAGDISQAVMSKIPNLPPAYAKYLQDAAKKGGNALAVAHFILGQQDSTYQAATKKDE